MTNPNYKTFTVRDLMDIVSTDSKAFPKGLDTPIATGDFEGNYHHHLHKAFQRLQGRQKQGDSPVL